MPTPISEFFGTEKWDDTEVKVAIKPMTEEQAREAYPYRPYSKYSESYFGGDNMVDDKGLLSGGVAKRCKMCQATTRDRYLNSDGICPDCDGRSEYNGTDPHN